MALPKKRPQSSMPAFIEEDTTPNDESWDTEFWGDSGAELGDEEFDFEDSHRSQPEVVYDNDITTLTSQRSIAGVSEDIALIGQLTAHDLMVNPWRKWEHLEPIVYKLTERIQKRLSDENEADRIKTARNVGGKKYEEAVRVIEAMILRETNKESPGKVNPFRVSHDDKPVLVARVINEIMGLGPLEPLYADPSITEIMANSFDDIQVEIRGTLHRVPGARFRNDDHLFDVASGMLNTVNRRIDIKSPLADGRLPDKSRINVVHPNIADGNTALTIRKHPENSWSIQDMVEVGAMSEEVALELGFLIYNRCTSIIVGGTGTGKQLDDRTLLPTPTGWITMGEVAVGDYVMAPSGHPTKVTGKFQDKPDVEAYLVTFSDGSYIVADADHNWFTYAHQSGDESYPDLLSSTPQVRTTHEILESLSTSEGSPNHAVQVAQAVEYTVDNADDRTIDPYLLGTWLAGGTTQDAEVPVLALRRLGLLEAVRIPDSYMLAPQKARRDLLAGLLDHAGEVDEQGNIVLRGSYGDVEQTRVFIQSLGHIVYRKDNELSFHSDEPVFTDPIRNERHAATKREDVRHTFRYIVDVQPYDEDVSMHCITVDSEDHLYLAGEAFITTHNTSMLNALSGAFPKTVRTITVEDNLELKLNPDRTVLSLEARAAAASGEGEVTIRDLVRNALRMRPDRIIVGEVRDGTAYDMLQAMNTGHEGSMTTIHANDAYSGMDRIANLAMESGNVNAQGVNSLIAGSVDLIIEINRFYEDGSRRISGVYEVPNRPHFDEEAGASVLTPIPLWVWNHTNTRGDGTVEGSYEKINDVSAGLAKKKRLDVAHDFTLEELYELSNHS